LWVRDARRKATDLPDGASGIFGRKRVDGSKRLERKSEISFSVRAAQRRFDSVSKRCRLWSVRAIGN